MQLIIDRCVSISALQINAVFVPSQRCVHGRRLVQNQHDIGRFGGNEGAGLPCAEGFQSQIELVIRIALGNRLINDQTAAIIVGNGNGHITAQRHGTKSTVLCAGDGGGSIRCVAGGCIVRQLRDLHSGGGQDALDHHGLLRFQRNDTLLGNILQLICAQISIVNGGYMVHSQGIPAKNLSDALYFVVYAKLADGSYVYSDMYSYSAKAYAEDRLANSTSDKTKALCVAMLNYGAAVQLNFGYKTDALMNSDLTAEQLDLVAGYDSSMIEGILAVDSGKTGVFAGTNGGFTKLEPSVSFEGVFSVNYYFTPANTPDGEMTLYCWDEATYLSAEELTAENAIAVKTMTADNGVYSAAYTDIAAKQIDETVFVCGVYESNGVRYSTGVLVYSLGEYCRDRIANGSETMSALAQATAAYGYFAKAYFTSQ